MPYYRSTITLELWHSAADEQQAGEQVDAITEAATRARPDVNVTVGAESIEEVIPSVSDLADMRAGV